MKENIKDIKKVRVLYIAGPTRSGSTLIGNILGQVDGVFNAGEVIEAWDRGRIWKCSCGKKPAECEVWSKIFDNVYNIVSKRQKEYIIQKRNEVSRSHKILYNLIKNKKNHIDTENNKQYQKGMETLYSEIREVTQASMIVDTSKNIGYLESLTKMPFIDLYIVHLVRDSRATVFSWSKKKEELWKISAVRTAMVWGVRNITMEIIKNMYGLKYLKIKYENFVDSPIDTIKNIMRFIDYSDAELPFVRRNEVVIEKSHGLCGNPGRYNRGVEKIESDNRWKNMKKKDTLIATLITFPILKKYGYKIF